MHMSDGLVTAPVAVVSAVVAAGALAFAARHAARGERNNVAWVGMMAAFIFVAQMINVPIIPGASGHILGAGLAVVALGVAPAMLAMAVVVVVQALFFHDGGITTLGANLLNMAVVAPLAAGCVLKLFGKTSHVSNFLAATAGMFAAAGLCAVEITASGTLSVNIAPLFMGVHFLIALFEGIATALVAAAMARHGAVTVEAPRGNRALAGIGLVLLLAAPLACSWPDGLEYMLERQEAAVEASSAIEAAEEEAQPWEWTGLAFFADYETEGVSGPLSTWLAACAGVLMVFAVGWGAGRVMRRQNAA